MKNLIVLIFGVCLCVAFVNGRSQESVTQKTAGQLDSSVHVGHDIMTREAVTYRASDTCSNPNDSSKCQELCSQVGQPGGRCSGSTCQCV